MAEISCRLICLLDCAMDPKDRLSISQDSSYMAEDYRISNFSRMSLRVIPTMALSSLASFLSSSTKVNSDLLPSMEQKDYSSDCTGFIYNNMEQSGEAIMGEEENGDGFFGREMGTVEVLVMRGRKGGKGGEDRVIVPGEEEGMWNGGNEGWQSGRRNGYGFRKEYQQKKKIKYVEKIVEQPKEELQPIEVPSSINEQQQQQLNMAYIQLFSDTASEARSCNLMSLLEQSEMQDLMRGELPIVSINLNPTEVKRRVKKVYLEASEVADYDGCSEAESGLDGSIRSLSEKSLELTAMIAKELQRYKRMQDFKDCPKREVMVSFTTNGYVQELRVKSIRLVALNRVLAINECKKCELLSMDQTEYSLPNNQYREQTKTITLCRMSVPQLSIIPSEEYSQILAGELLKIETLALRCACLGKNTVSIHPPGIGCESCQRCSMSLKVVVNWITLGK